MSANPAYGPVHAPNLPPAPSRVKGLTPAPDGAWHRLLLGVETGKSSAQTGKLTVLTGRTGRRCDGGCHRDVGLFAFLGGSAREEIG